MRYFFTLVSLLGIVFLSGSFKYKEPAGRPSGEAVNATSQANPAIGLNLGNQAPEISLKNPEGVVITLSSLRGKMVLIDFWASWCGPCRHENPNVVKAYSLYKDKQLKGGNGFTIYSVSLDTGTGPWKKAIENDGLSWNYHVSDLRGWNNEAALRYNVRSIPSNFLINDQGIIINKDLAGDDLLKALDKLVVK